MKKSPEAAAVENVVPAHETYPSLCMSVGLSCETCVTDSSAHLAHVCRGLRGPMLAQLFVQIYTDPACSPMAPRFAAEYRRASIRSEALQIELLAEVISPIPFAPASAKDSGLPASARAARASVA